MYLAVFNHSTIMTIIHKMAEDLVNKKARIEDNANLSLFQLNKELGLSAFTKKVFLQGKLKDKPGDAVVILEKTPFSGKDFPAIFQESRSSNVYFENDIYLSFCHFPPIEYGGIKTTLIYPATEDLIKKYTFEPNGLCEETAELYKTITEPYITENHSPPEWVYNVLDHKSESDRIIYEDTDKESGFILLPDLKWDGKNPEAFYVQALPHIRSLRTIRDLTVNHLPLLNKIAQIGPEVIAEKYNIAKSQLLIYLHYLPSFCHIHVHFKLIGVEGTSGTGCERAHLLSTVINNLQLCSEYYKKATLPISLKKSDELLKKLLAD